MIRIHSFVTPVYGQQTDYIDDETHKHRFTLIQKRLDIPKQVAWWFELCSHHVGRICTPCYLDDNGLALAFLELDRFFVCVFVLFMARQRPIVVRPARA